MKRDITRDKKNEIEIEIHCIEHSKKKEFDTSDKQCKLNEGQFLKFFYCFYGFPQFTPSWRV